MRVSLSAREPDVAGFVERHIAQVLLVAQTDDGELSLVRYTDGGWGIARNREAMNDHYWSATEVDRSVEGFLRLTKLGKFK